MSAMPILGISFVPVFPIHLFEQTLIYCNMHSFHEEKKRRRKKVAMKVILVANDPRILCQ